MGVELTKTGKAATGDASGLVALQTMGASILDRLGLMQRMGKSFKGRRDLYYECGYPKTLDCEDYLSRFTRQDIAGRICTAYPDATWATDPEVYETEERDQTQFEKAWDDLASRTKLYHYLHRADTLAGIGEFGVLLLGLDDNQQLSAPLQKRAGQGLKYLQPYSQGSITVPIWDTDPKSERYSLPVMYSVAMGIGTGHTMSQQVHWTRILHIAEGCLESDVYGTPKLRPVWNRLQDIETIAAGSAEMFWKGGFQGIAFQADADADLSKQAKEEMNEELQKYFMGLQRYLRLQGVNANPLPSQVAPPNSHVDVQVQLIASATGIPVRILMGSEQAQLASGQDDTHWRDRVGERRNNYAAPFMVKPLIQRLLDFGILPPLQAGNELTVKWPMEDVLTSLQKAQLAQTRTAAMAQYADSGASAIMSPFQWLVHELGYEDDEAQEILAQTKAERAKEKPVREEGQGSEQQRPFPAQEGEPAPAPTGEGEEEEEVEVRR